MKTQRRNIRPSFLGEMGTDLSKMLLGSAHGHRKTSRQLRRAKQKKRPKSVLDWCV